MGMHKRLTRSIRKSGITEPESLAAYLIARGWRDTEKQPRIQQVTVTPNPLVRQIGQPQMMGLPDVRTLPVDFSKERFLQ